MANEAQKTIFDDLIGCYIKEMYINDDTIIFTIHKGDPYNTSLFVVHASGDCCSRSYIHSVENILNLFAHRVCSVTTGDITEMNELKYQETGEQHEYFIGVQPWAEAEISYTRITMRNESNGYYGGELVKSNIEYVLPSIALNGLARRDNSNQKDWINTFS